MTSQTEPYTTGRETLTRTLVGDGAHPMIGALIRDGGDRSAVLLDRYRRILCTGHKAQAGQWTTQREGGAALVISGNGRDQPAVYALGHSAPELERLSTQARLVDPITRRFFVAAGIGPGIIVLDVGSGAGDVAMLVSELVGASGEVVGTDISTAALASARARVERRGLSNVSFLDGDPAGMAFTERFDAVVGRYILQFIDDPVGAVVRLAGHVRPGGLVPSTSWTGTGRGRRRNHRRIGGAVDG